jgi:tRNA (adenine37-N6)-methyltransferase
VPIEVEPIGTVAGGRVQAVDDDWGDVESTITLDAGRVPPDATRGL